MSGRGRCSRAGVTVTEGLVALLVGLLLLHLSLQTLARFRVAHLDIGARADALVGLRVARHVLRSELRHAVAGRDWSAGRDSLAIRAYRGHALVCEADSTAADIVVAYRGVRAPEPTKDSVLLLGAHGVVGVRALVGMGGAASGCAHPGAPQRWRLHEGAPTGTVAVRLFERGSYHLRDAALRYRRGASGRQPLTPEVWSAASAFAVSSDRLAVRVVPARPAGSEWVGFLAWSEGP